MLSDILVQIKVGLFAIISFFSVFFIFKTKKRIKNLEEQVKKDKAEKTSLESELQSAIYTAKMEKEAKENIQETTKEVYKKDKQVTTEKNKIEKKILQTPDNIEYGVDL